MSGIGFGLERIGLAAISRPLPFVVLLIAATLSAVFFMTSVTFNGSVTGVLPKTSANYLAYETQKREFRNFSRDVAVIVQSDTLQTADGLEALRDLQLELSLTDNVLSAVSIMAFPEFNTQTGEFQSYFPGDLGDDQQVKARLDELLTSHPQARSIFSSDANAAVVLVALDIEGDTGNDEKAFEIFRNLVNAVDEVAAPGFTISYAGLTPIGLTILETLLTDQLRLTLFGLALGAFIAILFFRSVIAAIFCAIPPILTAIWSIGFFGMVGVPVTYMTTILPTLALVLAYADGIVLFHRWNKLNRDGDHDSESLKANLVDAVKRVGPASALTSLTTAFALSSFALSQSEALVEFAWVGIVLVFSAFLAVIVSIPVMGLGMIRLGWVSTGTKVNSSFRLGSLAASIFERVPLMISTVALIAIGGFFVIHSKLEPNYTITDLLPRDSLSFEAERVANDVFGGRSLVFFQIPTVGEGGVQATENRARLTEVASVLRKAFGEDKVFAIDALWDGMDEQATNTIVDRLADAPDFFRQGYLSQSGDQMLVSLRVPSSQSITQTQAQLVEIDTALSGLSFRDQIVTTGFPVLLATEFSDMINELRRNLVFAAFMGILLIGIATRSLICAVVVAVPNLFPILFIEAIIYFSIGSISVTEVVALTLAFGIAIDNAVHVINVYQGQGMDKPVRERLHDAVVEVAPALAASTLIICAGTAIGLTSSLPILTTICGLIVSTLLVALLTNLIILPANILSVERLFGSR